MRLTFQGIYYTGCRPNPGVQMEHPTAQSVEQRFLNQLPKSYRNREGAVKFPTSAVWMHDTGSFGWFGVLIDGKDYKDYRLVLMNKNVQYPVKNPFDYYCNTLPSQMTQI